MGKISREDAFILWLMSLEIGDPWRVLQRFGTAEGVFRSGIFGSNRDGLEKLVRQAEAWLDEGICFISHKNPDFPARLQTMPDKPLGLFVVGDLPDAILPAVAIVGARDNTHYGRQVARQIAEELAAVGVVVVSGMARGLDAHAHEGALAARGLTVAVMPSGVDVCYPAENFQTYRRVRETGCVVSEFFPGTRPQRWSFPARNRIITAMADVLVVVEAGERSGTSTTVSHALAQGKEVFAVPGRIFDKKSAGTNQLIKQGAHILTTYLDVLLALKEQRHLAGFFDVATKASSGRLCVAEEKLTQNFNPPLATDEALVYDCLSYDAVTVDYIAYKTGLDIAGLNKMLLDMELAGRIKKLPGQKYIRN
ncbi:MAG: DNA-processing protein DprA [Defluviitaleaceae bacterium]|nr:DNA-processing protein DprA [Defluviitaleaceae bacterium]